MFHRRHFLKTLGLLALAPYACTTDQLDLVEPPDEPPPEPPGGNPTRVAVSADDPHYFTLNGEPRFMLGFGNPLDWYHPTRYEEMKAAYIDRGLSYARIFLPFAAPAAEVVAYTHERTGPGTALDGGLKFDLTKIDSAFLDRLEDMVAWAEAHEIIVAVGLWHRWPFLNIAGGEATDYNWQGSVVNPQNRINTEADELAARQETGPDFFSILTPSSRWTTDADRQWLRDRVKELYDAILLRLSPYGNWYFELGSRSYFGATQKRYWASYVTGSSHAIDDGAVSPNAKPDLLLSDQIGEPSFGDILDSGLVHQITVVESGAASPVANVAEKLAEQQSWEGDDRILYDDGGGAGNPLVMLATNEGYALSDGRANRRRSAWQALVAGGHYEATDNPEATLPSPAWSADYLPDFQVLSDFLRRDRAGATIESLLIRMRPNNSRITAGTAYCSEAQPGQVERYLVFANAGQNPTVTLDSPGLTITRLDVLTGLEDTDPASPTVAGNNTLTGTGNDTAWWITP